MELVLVLSYVGGAFVPWATLLLGGPPSGGPLQHVVAVLFSMVAASLVAFDLVARRHVRAYGAPSERPEPLATRLRLRVADVAATAIIVSVSSFVLVATMLPSPRESGIIACAVGFLASFSCLLMQRRIAGFGSRGSLVPMDETPIHGELQAIARHFGWDKAAFLLLTTRRDAEVSGGASPSHVAFALKTWLFDVRRPSIPIEIVQALEPCELTAVVAFRYAYATPYSPQSLVRSLATYLLLVAGGLAVAILFLRGWLAIVGNMSPAVPVLAFLAYSWLLTFPFLRMSGLLRTPDYTHRRAFEAWAAAAPGSGRTFADYARSIAVRERLLLGLGPGADLERLARREPALARLAAHFGGTSTPRA